MNQPVLLTGLGASLAINAYRTLTSLEIGIYVVRDDYDPLCGLSHELGFIAGINIIEELYLDVLVRVGTRWRTEDLSAFDSVLTEPGAFPILRRVSVKIWWYLECKPEDQEDRDDVDAMFKLESSKEDKFPRLVESKAVEFNFSTEIHYLSES